MPLPDKAKSIDLSCWSGSGAVAAEWILVSNTTGCKIRQWNLLILYHATRRLALIEHRHWAVVLYEWCDLLAGNFKNSCHITTWNCSQEHHCSHVHLSHWPMFLRLLILWSGARAASWMRWSSSLDHISRSRFFQELGHPPYIQGTFFRWGKPSNRVSFIRFLQNVENLESVHVCESWCVWVEGGCTILACVHLA